VTLRIGQGIDVHPFSVDPGRRLVLGGVEIPGAPGLAGHSDADVVAHALCDALLGATGLGDLGHHFPDSDPAFAGADSLVLLSEVVRRVADAGFRPVNADCTVVAEAPKLSPYVASMVSGLTARLGAPVSVKATRGEGMGAVGRGEGVACLAVVLVERTAPEEGRT
jgi:2-C-methyl-D-erythritol 2,4-cyclodiphosphate synthase